MFIILTIRTVASGVALTVDAFPSGSISAEMSVAFSITSYALLKVVVQFYRK